MKREVLEFDVVIIGAGPSGLSAAIRLAQLCQKESNPLSICVLEKGAEVGAHILSGAVIEPKALTELFPNWKNMDCPIHVPVSEEDIYLLTPKTALSLPIPNPMRNKGNYIISLENFCRWLAKQAESLGVLIFPGFAAVHILYDDNNKICGVQTGDKGVDRNHQPTDRYQPGIQLLAKQTIFAEGARGSLTKQLIETFNLTKNRSPANLWAWHQRIMGDTKRQV